MIRILGLELRDHHVVTLLRAGKYGVVRSGRTTFSSPTNLTSTRLCRTRRKGNDIKQCDVLTAFKKRIISWKGPTCNCGFCAQCRISNRWSWIIMLLIISLIFRTRDIFFSFHLHICCIYCIFCCTYCVWLWSRRNSEFASVVFTISSDFKWKLLLSLSSRQEAGPDSVVCPKSRYEITNQFDLYQNYINRPTM